MFGGNTMIPCFWDANLPFCRLHNIPIKRTETTHQRQSGNTTWCNEEGVHKHGWYFLDEFTLKFIPVVFDTLNSSLTIATMSSRQMHRLSVYVLVELCSHMSDYTLRTYHFPANLLRTIINPMRQHLIVHYCTYTRELIVYHQVHSVPHHRLRVLN